jgi:hypothetical protein
MNGCNYPNAFLSGGVLKGLLKVFIRQKAFEFLRSIYAQPEKDEEKTKAPRRKLYPKNGPAAFRK